MNRLATVKKYRNKQSFIITLCMIPLLFLVILVFKDSGLINTKELTPSNASSDNYRMVTIEKMADILATDTEDKMYFADTLVADGRVLIVVAKEKAELEQLATQIEKEPTPVKGGLKKLGKDDIAALKDQYDSQGFKSYEYALELNKIPASEYIALAVCPLPFLFIPLILFLKLRRSKKISTYLTEHSELNEMPASATINKHVEIVGDILFSYQRPDFVDLTKYVDFKFLVLQQSIAKFLKINTGMSLMCVKPDGKERAIALYRLNATQRAELEKALQPYRKTGGEGSIDTSTITTKPSF